MQTFLCIRADHGVKDPFCELCGNGGKHLAGVVAETISGAGLDLRTLGDAVHADIGQVVIFQ